MHLLTILGGGSDCQTPRCDNRGMVDQMKSDEAVFLDATGLRCPMPLLKAKKALNEIEPGTRLRVVATDPGSVRDFAVFSEQSGHALLESEEQDGQYTYLLEKRARPRA